VPAMSGGKPCAGCAVLPALRSQSGELIDDTTAHAH
jgi:hypothetical protein